MTSILFLKYERIYKSKLSVCTAASLIGSRNISDWWLSFWISQTKNHSHSGISTYTNMLLPNYSPLRPHNIIETMYYNDTNLRNFASFSTSTSNVTFYLTIYAAIAVGNTVSNIIFVRNGSLYIINYNSYSVYFMLDVYTAKGIFIRVWWYMCCKSLT